MRRNLKDMGLIFIVGIILAFQTTGRADGVTHVEEAPSKLIGVQPAETLVSTLTLSEKENRFTGFTLELKKPLVIKAGQTVVYFQDGKIFNHGERADQGTGKEDRANLKNPHCVLKVTLSPETAYTIPPQKVTLKVSTRGFQRLPDYDRSPMAHRKREFSGDDKPFHRVFVVKSSEVWTYDLLKDGSKESAPLMREIACYNREEIIEKASDNVRLLRTVSPNTANQQIFGGAMELRPSR